MRAVAYSIRSFEKEPLAKANHKKHDITLISNPIGLETVEYAAGKEAVIISADDHVSEAVMIRLAALGVKFITIRSKNADNIDHVTASKLNIKIAVVSIPAGAPVTGPEFVLHQYEIAASTVRNLDSWQESRNITDITENISPMANNNIIPAKTGKQ